MPPDPRPRRTKRALAPSEPPIAGEPAFVGRVAELRAVLGFLAFGAPVVSILGLGGVGKTSLARRVARELSGRGDQPLFVDLSAARSRIDVVDAVAGALGRVAVTARDDERAVDAIGNALADVARSGELPVLVLDNVEQIAEQAASVVARWLALAPSLRVLATSRTRLGLRDEHAVRLEPLPTESNDTSLSEAAQLLTLRARAIASIDLLPRDAEALARALEGWPLAIGLAAARLTILSPTELIESVRRDDALLASAVHDVPERHRSVTRAIASSWELLAPSDRLALARLAAFRGSVARGAAERALADLDGAPLDRIQRLVDASLLRRRESCAGTRYAFYELVQSDIERRTIALGLEREVTDVHARVTLAIARERLAALRATGDAFGEAARDALDALLEEQSNVAAALARAEGDVALDLVVVLGTMLALRGHPGTFVAEAGRVVESTVTTGVDRTRLGWALVALGRARLELGDAAGAEAAFERARGIARDADEARVALHARLWHARSLAIRGMVHEAVATFAACGAEAITLRDDEAAAHAAAFDELHGSEIRIAIALGPSLEAAYRWFRAHGHPREALFWAVQLGRGNVECGSVEAATTVLEEAATIASRFLDATAEGLARFGLGTSMMERGDLEGALRSLETAVALLETAGVLRYVGYARAWHGTIQLLAGRDEEAVATLERAIGVLEAAGDTPNAGLFGSMLAAAHAQVGHTDRAARALATAHARIHAPTDVWRARTLELNAGHLHLAAAREASARGDGEAATDAIAEAARIAKSTPSFDGAGVLVESLEARVAVRILCTAIGEVRARAEPWKIAQDGSAFRAPGGDVVRVPGRGANQRILALLGRARIAHAGIPVRREDLVSAGWPGERLREEAASNRLSVALDGLRRLGLRPVLVRAPSGWSLDPAIPCDVTADL